MVLNIVTLYRVRITIDVPTVLLPIGQANLPVYSDGWKRRNLAIVVISSILARSARRRFKDIPGILLDNIVAFDKLCRIIIADIPHFRIPKVTRRTAVVWFHSQVNGSTIHV